MSADNSILAFAGSTRAASGNKQVLAVAVAAARDAGARVTTIDLRDYALPLYDGDLEERDGVPASAVELGELFRSHRGLLLASPEYNGSITAVLKNALDWVSRPLAEQAAMTAFSGKVGALVSASPGPLGGLRSQAHLRQILSGIGVTVIPEHASVPGLRADSFDAEGRLTDDGHQRRVGRVGTALAQFLARLSA